MHGSFAIDSATGEITTTAMLDYEMQDSYMVTVTATDDDEATAMIYVTIMVTNVGLDNKRTTRTTAAISAGKRLSGPSTTILLEGSIDRATVIAVINLYLNS